MGHWPRKRQPSFPLSPDNKNGPRKFKSASPSGEKMCEPYPALLILAGGRKYTPNCAHNMRRFLHTAEVRGSSPLSPTTFLSTTCTIPRPGKTTVVPKFRLRKLFYDRPEVLIGQVRMNVCGRDGLMSQAEYQRDFSSIHLIMTSRARPMFPVWQ